MATTILYSFRRCPYCMRAHMALKYAGLKTELREVDLKALPPPLLTLSAHNTVPLLQLSDGTVIDESWDILKWALAHNDPDNWLGENKAHLLDAEILVESNDYTFKSDLDHYKYADRFPEHSQEYYRLACEVFIAELETMLEANSFLLGKQLSLADIAVFPFVRQFSLVDESWFEQSPYVQVKQWLNYLINTELFQHSFQKHECWQVGDSTVYL